MTTRNATEHAAERRLIDLMAGCRQTQAVHTAAELGLADRIAAAGRVSVADLAHRTGTDADALGRLLLFLDGLGVVDGDETGGYALTPVGELLRTNIPGSMSDHVRFHGSHTYQAWGALTHTLHTGRAAFTRVFGTDLFSYLHQNPDVAAMYEGAMAAGTPFLGEVPEIFDFSGARRIVDVAGGHGELLDAILRANPGPRAVLFDAPEVIEEAAHRPIATAHADRCERVAGDLFASVPADGDVYLLARILHCFDDESCVRILTNCRRAMAPDARLLIVERLLAQEREDGADGEDPASPLTQGHHLHMLVVLGEGRERDEAHYGALLEKAGFAVESRHRLPLESHLLVAVPS